LVAGDERAELDLDAEAALAIAPRRPGADRDGVSETPTASPNQTQTGQK